MSREKRGFVVVGLLDGKPTVLERLKMPQHRDVNGLLVPITNRQGTLFKTRIEAQKAVRKTRNSKHGWGQWITDMVICPLVD